MWTIARGRCACTANGFDVDASASLFDTAVTRPRSCTVNVTMTNGRVERVNYIGPTGGLLTPGEQCAYAVLLRAVGTK
jgi:hypothetical protein